MTVSDAIEPNPISGLLFGLVWQLSHTLWPSLLGWVLLYVAGQIVVWRSLFLAPPADAPLQPLSNRSV